ncbi:ATP-dependent Clp protease adaptor ClpS [Sphingobacterium bovistauri]|uniref:ATP-dependent Clp protease adaptor ClpS n=1 Tax=Sphingobacterium bovistauri TaxID=2781959 RepID=A0ABS7Z701_9SPHI|nr:ATP-dependent Clp protease adaptor ClpS [Sphingobacterium bovistauri]MCA5005932.1 ATP-dependent Clp protease adaptor ClpS [Sphingobacterium bovistauri]
MSVETTQETYTLEEILASVKESHRLILWNDDTNTFDHVIYCLIHHLQYTEGEAERIAWTVHNDGKCAILEGSFTEMEIYRKILKAEGLTVSVE